MPMRGSAAATENTTKISCLQTLEKIRALDPVAFAALSHCAYDNCSVTAPIRAVNTDVQDVYSSQAPEMPFLVEAGEGCW